MMARNFIFVWEILYLYENISEKDTGSWINMTLDTSIETLKKKNKSIRVVEYSLYFLSK